MKTHNIDDYSEQEFSLLRKVFDDRMETDEYIN